MSNIHIQLNESICCISLQRPDKKNAITAGMYQDMADALVSASNNANIKVIVLTGSEGNFTAGNDLADFLANPDIQPGSSVHQFLQALMHCPLPVIAAVGGYAVGIGSTMLLHCEQVFADESARFSFPFINLGLVPEAGSTLLLPRLLGFQRAADLLLSGRLITAAEAKNTGLVADVVAGNVNEAAMAYARNLATKSRAMLIEIKALLKRPEETLQQRADVELESFVRCLNSDAAKEAMTAFLEKRKPDFSTL